MYNRYDAQTKFIDRVFILTCCATYFVCNFLNSNHYVQHLFHTTICLLVHLRCLTRCMVAILAPGMPSTNVSTRRD